MLLSSWQKKKDGTWGSYDNSKLSLLGSEALLWYFGEWSVLLIWPLRAQFFSFLFKDCLPYMISLRPEVVPSPSTWALGKETNQPESTFHCLPTNQLCDISNYPETEENFLCQKEPCQALYQKFLKTVMSKWRDSHQSRMWFFVQDR